MKDNVLAYLQREKEDVENEIALLNTLSIPELVDLGLVIDQLRLMYQEENEYIFAVENNDSKLRSGDRVTLIDESGKKYNAQIIECDVNEVSLISQTQISASSFFMIRLNQVMLLDPIISLIDNITDGKPGDFLMNILSQKVLPLSESFGSIDTFTINKYLKDSDLDIYQQNAIEKALKRPSVLNIQGPPGTGKTKVLANIAGIFANEQNDVVVISFTHQAVNNALNKIKELYPDTSVVKIGEKIKSQGLNTQIETIAYREFTLQNQISNKIKRKSKKASIIGMTFHSSIINLGLLNRSFYPSVLLVDEAGQLPLTYSSALGAYGAGCVIFIGDDRQMPPIYRPSLSNDVLSKSIFEYIREILPDSIVPLSMTYRMNDEITAYIDKHFYADKGIPFLKSSSYSSIRRLNINCEYMEQTVKEFFSKSTSILWANPTLENSWEDQNPEEANFVIRLINSAINGGLEYSKIGVVTPFRRQARLIKSLAKERFGDKMPIIDTVERLQGQDVEFVIISFAASDPNFIFKTSSFILNKNRINVMFSRAKTKVIYLASDSLIRADFELHYNLLNC